MQHDYLDLTKNVFLTYVFLFAQFGVKQACKNYKVDVRTGKTFLMRSETGGKLVKPYLGKHFFRNRNNDVIPFETALEQGVEAVSSFARTSTSIFLGAC